MTVPHIALDIVYHIDLNEIDLNGEQPFRDDSARFRAAAAWVASRFCIAELTASISIVDDTTIQELNREHLQHDWPTDVISFVFERIDKTEGPEIDGEVIASSETARRMSKQAGWSPEDELLLYCVHGLLHLAGLDDIEDDDKQNMRVAEQECLIGLGIENGDQHLARWKDVTS